MSAVIKDSSKTVQMVSNYCCECSTDIIAQAEVREAHVALRLELHDASRTYACHYSELYEYLEYKIFNWVVPLYTVCNIGSRYRITRIFCE